MTEHSRNHLRSVVPAGWPERTNGDLAALLLDARVIGHLDRQPKPLVQAYQQRRLGELLTHANAASPWWRERLASLPKGRLSLADLPLLDRAGFRASIEQVGGALPLPPEHGRAIQNTSSGSTGFPVTFFASSLAARLIRAEWYHDDARQGRDPNRTRAELKGSVPEHPGEHLIARPNPLLGSGVSYRRRSSVSTIEAHAAWLARVKPAYFATMPVILSGLLDVFESGAVEAPRVDQILTYGETVDRTLRDRARTIIGASIRDRYSSEEFGPIAFQCPTSEEHYHLASANVIVEILDEAGRPSPPDTPGRVFVTGLHTHASPVIRYELNDLSSWHSVCGCGRPGPVLTRLLGRERFLVRLPSGERQAVRIMGRDWLAAAPVREHRLVQISERTLRAELVLDRPLTSDERQATIAMLQKLSSTEKVSAPSGTVSPTTLMVMVSDVG